MLSWDKCCELYNLGFPQPLSKVGQMWYYAFDEAMVIYMTEGKAKENELNNNSDVGSIILYETEGVFDPDEGVFVNTYDRNFKYIPTIEDFLREMEGAKLDFLTGIWNLEYKGKIYQGADVDEVLYKAYCEAKNKIL